MKILRRKVVFYSFYGRLIIPTFEPMFEYFVRVYDTIQFAQVVVQDLSYIQEIRNT